MPAPPTGPAGFLVSGAMELPFRDGRLLVAAEPVEAAAAVHQPSRGTGDDGPDLLDAPLPSLPKVGSDAIGRSARRFRILTGGDYSDRMAHQSGAFRQLQLCLWLPLQIHCLADPRQLPLGGRLRDSGRVFRCDPP